MTHRVSELATRRQMLVLRSERLREELVAQNFAIRRSIGGVDRVVSIARGVKSPLLLVGAGLMALRLMRGRRRVRKVGSVTWGVRAMMLVSMIRKALPLAMPLLQLFRTFSRSRTERGQW
jgi:hypothetical protein